MGSFCPSTSEKKDKDNKPDDNSDCNKELDIKPCNLFFYK